MENQITDVTPLAGLTNLQSLALNNNQITDVSPIAEFTNLKPLYVYLEDNQITDISPLAGLTNSVSLFLKGNPIPSDSFEGILNCSPQLRCSIAN